MAAHIKIDIQLNESMGIKIDMWFQIHVASNPFMLLPTVAF